MAGIATALKKRRRPNRVPKRDPKPKGQIETINALPADEFRSRYWPEDLVQSLLAPFLATNPTTAATPSSPPPDTAQEPPKDETKQLIVPKLSLSLHNSSDLSSEDFSACFALVRDLNEEDYAASSIGWHPAKKKAEMKSPDLKYILLKEASPSNQSTTTTTETNETNEATQTPTPVLAFLSFMPTYEFSHPVLYIYEIQLSPLLQNRTLGPRLLRIAEQIALNCAAPQKLMLTVFRANERARRVYVERCGFEVDEGSPGPRKLRGGRGRGECEYVILSKGLVVGEEEEGRFVG